MKNADGKLICGYTIEVKWPGHRVILHRYYCQRRVRVEGQRCWQHKR